MHVNNELGVVQDLEAIGELARSRKIFFHSDAAQSAGKVEIDVNRRSFFCLQKQKVQKPGSLRDIKTHLF
jgi:cysteine sulfinate desulfinase/cysteine desulfurase-like protein